MATPDQLAVEQVQPWKTQVLSSAKQRACIDRDTAIRLWEGHGCLTHATVAVQAFHRACSHSNRLPAQVTLSSLRAAKDIYYVGPSNTPRKGYVCFRQATCLNDRLRRTERSIRSSLWVFLPYLKHGQPRFATICVRPVAAGYPAQQMQNQTPHPGAQRTNTNITRMGEQHHHRQPSSKAFRQTQRHGPGLVPVRLRTFLSHRTDQKFICRVPMNEEG